MCMEREELRHERRTASLLTDHVVFSSKYCMKILVGDVALALDGIIRKTCKDLGIEIIDMAVNVDHVHLFVKCPPKYCGLYSQENKREGERTAQGPKRYVKLCPVYIL